MKEKYKSRFSLDTNKQPSLLKKEATRFVSKNIRIHSKALKRKINLSKVVEAIGQRKSSRTKRLRCFITAVDILKNSKFFTKREFHGVKEYSIMGYSAENTEVEVHLREEISQKKDKELFMVSCFYK